MNHNRAENLTITKKYQVWCFQADGKSELSVRKIHYELNKFLDYLGSMNLKTISIKVIISYKEDLKSKCSSKATYCSNITIIKRFLGWLMGQSGYKKILTAELISYMQPTSEEKRLAQQPAYRNIMPLESVNALLDSIEEDTPIGLRDRAIVSLLMTTGIRHKALITLPLGCVNLKDGYIDQDPRRGVRTKFTKSFKSAICNLDSRFIKSLENWECYLRKHCFGDTDPFIPRAKVFFNKENNCFCKAIDVEKEYWRSHKSMSRVLRERCQQVGLPYFPPHNFRHLLVKILKEKNLSSKESKCFSQSLGHEHEDTTYGCYGKFSDEEVLSVVSGIDFQTENHQDIINEKDISEFREFKKYLKMKEINSKEGNNENESNIQEALFSVNPSEQPSNLKNKKKSKNSQALPADKGILQK